MLNLVKGIFAGAVALSGLYVLSTQGRTGHPGLRALKGWKYAHRGLHDAEKCENRHGVPCQERIRQKDKRT